MDETIIQAFIKEFIEKLGVTIETIEPMSIAGQHMYAVRTPDSKELIGPHGEHLRALNYILRKFAEKKFETKENHFMVDVNGYQSKNIRELEQKASLLAERVRTFKSSADMAPMSAYERMIIHSMFSDDEHIATESEGFGATRHVVLRYKESKEL
jgi:spoIIIJ-associated protein